MIERLPFNHDNENLFAACGVTEDDMLRVFNNPFEAELPYLLRVTSLLATLFVDRIGDVPSENLTPLSRVFRLVVIGALSAFNKKSEVAQFIEEKILESLSKENISTLRSSIIQLLLLLSS